MQSRRSRCKERGQLAHDHTTAVGGGEGVGTAGLHTQVCLMPEPAVHDLDMTTPAPRRPSRNLGTDFASGMWIQN